MADFTKLLTLEGQMFILIIAGVILRKTEIMPKSANLVLTDLLLYIVLPCNIIHSFQMTLPDNALGRFGKILLVALLVQFAAYLLSKCLYRKEPEELRKVSRYVTMISNSGFLGFPIVEGIFGAEGMLYASFFIIPMRVMMWTCGITCFTGENGNGKKALLKVLLHPCIVAVYIGGILMATQVSLPGALDATIRGTGGCTTTISMITIGLILGDAQMKHIFSRELMEVIVVRLLLLPGVALLLSRIMGLSPVMGGVAVVLTAMPAGSTAAMLAAKYDGDSFFATKCVIVTTVLSLLTIPMWSVLIDRIAL